jgi:hypothetical protein
MEAGELRVARGRLSIHGTPKDDVGMSSTFEPSKGCASDTLKRCAVAWGIARYLYRLPQVHITLDERAQVPDSVTEKLRAALAKRIELAEAAASNGVHA